MKTATQVDIVTLKRAVASAEAEGPLANLTALHKTACDIYNGLKPEGYPSITASVVLLRIKEFGIPVITKPGKRGRQKGAGAVQRTDRRDKFKENPHFEEVKEGLLADVDIGENNALKIIDGSMKEAVASKCRQCCGGVTNEIRHCAIFDCALWLFRPYQPEGKIIPGDVLITGAE